VLVGANNWLHSHAIAVVLALVLALPLPRALSLAPPPPLARAISDFYFRDDVKLAKLVRVQDYLFRSCRFDSGKIFKNREPKSTSEHIELSAKLLDYFLRSNTSNINPCRCSCVCMYVCVRVCVCERMSERESL